MANISNDSQYNFVSGTTDNDYITNTGAYASVYAYAGADTIYNTNISHWSVIDAGAGNDSIYSYQGNYLTIRGGTGDDTIRIKSLYSNSHVIQYYSGDGNDYFIDEWDALTPNWTLEIGDGSGTYSTQTSGNDVIVTVGEGKITLANMASKSINIAGTYSSGSSSDELSNSNSNTLVSGTSEGDIITNQGNYVTIDAGAGNDSITNYGTAPSVTSFSVGKYAIILAGAGKDSVDNSGAYAIIDGGAGDDFILNTSYGTNSTITGGAGDDSIRNSANAKIYGGAGSDSITNTNLGANSTISGDAGNDYITTYNADNVSINGGAGADNIELRGSADDITVEGGTGNDFINIAGGSNLIKYSNGDGKDLIYGFNETSTLSIASGSYTSKKSGSDVIVTVGDGKISLIGAASLSKVNIKGLKKSTNSWKLNGTTATYGTSSKTLITVTGVKSLDGISLSGTTVTIAASSLNKKKVTISDGYTLALAKDVTKTSTKKAWSFSDDTATATYNQTTKAGYKLANNVITYTKKATKTLATVNGAKSKSGFNLDGNTIKMPTNSLYKKVSVSGSYGFEFTSDYKKAKITGSSSADTIKTAGANMTISGGKGNDSIVSKGKNSTITGGKGNDTLTGGSGVDIFVYSTGDGNDFITNFDAADKISLKSGTAEISTSGNNVIFTVGKGKITLKNVKGKNITYIEDGKKNIYSEKDNSVEYSADGKGATLMSSYIKTSFEPSGTYKDILVTINAAKVEQPLKITGNNKKNKITGTDDNDSIYGGTGADTILGGEGNDKLYGEKGNDSLIGGAGDDSLWGGADSDTLTGGAGADVFIYNNGDGNDTITDFESSVDKIRVLSGDVENPEADSSGNVTFAVGDGQIVIKGGADKYIPIYDSGKNILKKYNP